ncbi:hypothetical protein [Nocardioides marmorisolisilvae]|nr:hypothetical protein [Nocardioides marmorisolisilvae]
MAAERGKVLAAYTSLDGHLQSSTAREDTWRWVQPPSYLLDDESLPGWDEHAWRITCPSCPTLDQLVNEDRFKQRFHEALRVGDTAIDVRDLE